MKTITTPSICLLILILMISNSIYSQNIDLSITKIFTQNNGKQVEIQGLTGKKNKIKGGEKQGVHEQLVDVIDFEYFDKGQIIPNYFNSLKEIDAPISDKIKENKQFLVLIGEYEKGIPLGEFTLRYYYPKHTRYEFFNIAIWSHYDGKIQGQLQLYIPLYYGDYFFLDNPNKHNYFELNEFRSYYRKSEFVIRYIEAFSGINHLNNATILPYSLELDNGKLIDQKITCYDSLQYEFDKKGNTYKKYFKPYLEVSNEEVIEICRSANEKNHPIITRKDTDSILFIKKVTWMPKFLWKSMQEKRNNYNNDIGYGETAQDGTEAFYVKNGTFVGNYYYFNSTPFEIDSSMIKIVGQYKNGLRSGKAMIWDKFNEILLYEATFKNDTLNGPFTLYNNCGNIVYKCNIIDGKFVAHAESYWDLNCCYEKYSDWAIKNYRFAPKFSDSDTRESREYLLKEYEKFAKSISSRLGYGSRPVIDFCRPYIPKSFVNLERWSLDAGGGLTYREEKLFSVDRFKLLLNYISQGDSIDIPAKGYFKYCERDYINKTVQNDRYQTFEASVGTGQVVFFSGPDLISHTIWYDEDGHEVDYRYYDKDGLVIDSKEISEMKQVERLNALIEINNRLLNRHVNCDWCKKDLIVKNAVSSSYCNCFDPDDGYKEIIVSYSNAAYFCNYEHKKSFEKEICRSRGYVYERK